MNKVLKRFRAVIFVMMAITCGVSSRAHAQDAAQIPTAALIQPAQLATLERSSTGEKPIVLQVGSRVLYEEAHITGSLYAGAAGEDSGLQSLRQRTEKMNRKQSVVLYCGCCPWSHCPNIEPAYALMHSLGFNHLKVLYIANNFGTDWVAKGYPTEKGK